MNCKELQDSLTKSRDFARIARSSLRRIINRDVATVHGGSRYFRLSNMPTRENVCISGDNLSSLRREERSWCAYVLSRDTESLRFIRKRQRSSVEIITREDLIMNNDSKQDDYLSTQCAAVIAQFWFNNAAPHLCRYVDWRHWRNEICKGEFAMREKKKERER